ncbi:Striatin-4, partial [Coemansia javaensis]
PPDMAGDASINGLANGLANGLSSTAAFEQAVGVIQAEWRQVEAERAAWAVERLQLKARLSAAEKRSAQLAAQYVAAERHIAALEAVLRTTTTTSGPPAATTTAAAAAAAAAESPPEAASPAAPAQPPTAADIVEVTRATRARSRDLLRQCLAEIACLTDPLAAAGHSPPPPPALDSDSPPATAVIESAAADPPGAGGGTVEAAVEAAERPPDHRSIKGASSRRRRPSHHASEPGPELGPRSASADSLMPNPDPPMPVSMPMPVPMPVPKAMPSPDPFVARAPPPKDADATWSQDAAAEGLRRLAVDAPDAPAWLARRTLAGHMDCVRAVCAAGGGAQLLSGSDDGTVMLWDVARARRRRQRHVRHAGDAGPAAIFRGHLAAVTCVVAADGRQAAYSGGLDGAVHEWRLADTPGVEASFPVRSFGAHSDAVWGLALAPAAGLLASLSADATCRLWAVGDRAPVLRADLARPAAGTPTSACFVPAADARLAIAYDSGHIALRDADADGDDRSDDDRPRPPRAATMTRVTHVSCHPDSPHALAAAYTSGWVHLFDLRAGLHAPAASIAACSSDASVATAVALGPAEHCVVTGGSNGIVRWWDRRSPAASLCDIAAHGRKASEGVCALICAADAAEPFVATAGADGLLKLLYQNPLDARS